MVLAADAPVFFVVWGVPFLIAGLYIVAGRPSGTPILWNVADVRRVRDFVAHAQASPDHPGSPG